jgi:preprotein translocase subunit SecG
MMRNNGFVGLLWVIYASSREGFGKRRAAEVMAVIGLILATPLLIIALLIGLLIHFT